MILKIAIGSAVAAGAALLLAAPASAEGITYPGPTDETEHYVSVFDPQAYSIRGDDGLLLSPFGTGQPISCWSFHGQSGCWQTDPWGNNHVLVSIAIPTGSSAGSFRSLSVLNPFQ